MKSWDLFVVTSMSGFSLALFDPKKRTIFGHFHKLDQRGATQHLSAALEDLTKSSAVDLDMLGNIAICSGPGSFTGIRVGLAWAFGFSIGKKITWMPYSTLGLAARNVGQNLVLPSTSTRGFYADSSGKVGTIDHTNLDSLGDWQEVLPLREGNPALGVQTCVDAAWKQLILDYTQIKRTLQLPEAMYLRPSTAEELRQRKEQGAQHGIS